MVTTTLKSMHREVQIKHDFLMTSVELLWNFWNYRGNKDTNILDALKTYQKLISKWTIALSDLVMAITGLTGWLNKVIWSWQLQV